MWHWLTFHEHSRFAHLAARSIYQHRRALPLHINHEPFSLPKTGRRGCLPQQEKIMWIAQDSTFRAVLISFQVLNYRRCDHECQAMVNVTNGCMTFWHIHTIARKTRGRFYGLLWQLICIFLPDSSAEQAYAYQKTAKHRRAQIV